MVLGEKTASRSTGLHLPLGGGNLAKKTSQPAQTSALRTPRGREEVLKLLPHQTRELWWRLSPLVIPLGWPWCFGEVLEPPGAPCPQQRAQHGRGTGATAASLLPPPAQGQPRPPDAIKGAGPGAVGRWVALRENLFCPNSRGKSFSCCLPSALGSARCCQPGAALVGDREGWRRAQSRVWGGKGKFAAPKAGSGWAVKELRLSSRQGTASGAQRRGTGQDQGDRRQDQASELLHGAAGTPIPAPRC